MAAVKSRYSKKLARFIADQVALGKTIADVCVENKGKVPSAPATIYRWQNKYPEFHDMITEAYNSFIFVKMGELEDLTTKSLDELFPDIDDRTLKLEARRTRLDALKFIIGKIAPVLSARWSPDQKLEVKG